MITMSKLSKAIWQFCRWKPIFAWSIAGVLLSVALAYHDTGQLPIFIILSCFAIPILMQIVSHVHNDLSDLELDKADIENIIKTGRSKPIATGLISEAGAMLYSQVLIITLCVIVAIVICKPIFIAIVVGCISIVLYNDFLKNKPFTEITMILPLIMVITITPYVVITGTYTIELIALAFTHGMINALWFISSREQDKFNDASFGKNTTSVWCDKHDFKTATVQSMYMLAIVLVSGAMVQQHIEFMFVFITLLMFAATADRVPHEQRRIWIYLTVANAIIISLYLLTIP